MPDELDRGGVRRWVDTCLDVLTEHRDEIDRLNVFPVADADTGTNLLATVRAAAEALESAEPRCGPLDDLAAGALRGARGNSGLVLSQLLRGLAEAADGRALDADRLCAGLRRGATLAREAFAIPVDGTAITVLAAAADAAGAADTDKLAAVADAATVGAAAALADTPRLLPVLARAGVVDAGGRGVLLVLDALAAVAGGRLPEVAPVARVRRDPDVLSAPRPVPGASGNEYSAHEYEVMYLLDGTTEQRVTRLRAELAAIGDSVVVVGDGSVWNVHVHCTDIGAAVEAGVEAGRPHRITVVRFAGEQDPVPPVPVPLAARAVVAVAPGDGVAELMRGEGVAVVRPATGAATPDDVLAAIVGTGAGHVVVLPNCEDGTEVAEAAAARARDAGQDVVVVPTASPAQGLAALAVHDPLRRWDDDVVAMAEAAAATRCGELAVATEEALTWAGRCHPGDVLGLIDGEVVLIGRSVLEVGCDLVERMLSAGGEMVTALLGADAPDGLADALTRGLRRSHPEVEVTVYHGGQPGSPLSVGVE